MSFPKGMCLKVNVIAQSDFEHAYYDSAVQDFTHYATRTFPTDSFVWTQLNHFKLNYVTVTI